MLVKKREFRKLSGLSQRIVMAQVQAKLGASPGGLFLRFWGRDDPAI